MDNKIFLAAASAALVLSSSCAYNMRAGRTSSAPAPNRVVKVVTSAPVMPNTVTNAVIPNYTRAYVSANTSGNLGTLCENIYVNAQQGNWSACGKNYQALKTGWVGAQNVILAPATQNSRRAAVNKNLNALNSAIVRKDRYSAQKCANKLYKDFSDIVSLYNPSKTADIRSIKYFSREISMDYDKNNASSAKKNCAKLVQCWNSAKTLAGSNQQQMLVNSLNRSVGSGTGSTSKLYCSDLIAKCDTLEKQMSAKGL